MHRTRTIEAENQSALIIPETRYPIDQCKVVHEFSKYPAKKFLIERQTFGNNFFKMANFVCSICIKQI